MKGFIEVIPKEDEAISILININHIISVVDSDIILTFDPQHSDLTNTIEVKESYDQIKELIKQAQ